MPARRTKKGTRKWLSVTMHLADCRKLMRRVSLVEGMRWLVSGYVGETVAIGGLECQTRAMAGWWLKLKWMIEIAENRAFNELL
jgi:hypothetical protein